MAHYTAPIARHIFNRRASITVCFNNGNSNYMIINSNNASSIAIVVNRFDYWVVMRSKRSDGIVDGTTHTANVNNSHVELMWLVFGKTFLLISPGRQTIFERTPEHCLEMVMMILRYWRDGFVMLAHVPYRRSPMDLLQLSYSLLDRFSAEQFLVHSLFEFLLTVFSEDFSLVANPLTDPIEWIRSGSVGLVFP